MFRGDAGRRGNGGGDEPPADGGLVWSYAADVKTFFASPAVVGNRVYVSSADKGPLRDRGAIYCLDADSGGLVWKAAPSGYVATFSSPVVAGRFLVCGEGLHYTLNARVFCMDVLRQEVLWTYTTHGHVESTPCIDNGPRLRRRRRRRLLLFPPRARRRGPGGGALARPDRALPRCRHLAGGA